MAVDQVTVALPCAGEIQQVLNLVIRYGQAQMPAVAYQFRTGPVPNTCVVQILFHPCGAAPLAAEAVEEAFSEVNEGDVAEWTIVYGVD